MERTREGDTPDKQEGAADPDLSHSSHNPAPAPLLLSPLSLKLSSREAEAVIAGEYAETADAMPAMAGLGAAGDGGRVTARQPTDSAREEIERQVTAILEEVIGAYDAAESSARGQGGQRSASDDEVGRWSEGQLKDSAREEIARQVTAILVEGAYDAEAMAMSSFGSSAQSSPRGQERRSRPGCATVRPVSAKSRPGSAVPWRSPRAAAAAGAPRDDDEAAPAETTPGSALGDSLRTHCIAGGLPEVRTPQRGKGTTQRRNTSPTEASPSSCCSISTRRPWRYIYSYTYTCNTHTHTHTHTHTRSLSHTHTGQRELCRRQSPPARTLSSAREEARDCYCLRLDPGARASKHKN